MKGVGMLVVSLRGINFGFWSHLGCSGQNTIIFSRDGLVQGCTRKNTIYIYIVCVLTWSLLGVKKSLGPAQIGLLYGFNSKFPTSIPTHFICGVLAPGNFVLDLQLICILSTPNWQLQERFSMNSLFASNFIYSFQIFALTLFSVIHTEFA